MMCQLFFILLLCMALFIYPYKSSSYRSLSRYFSLNILKQSIKIEIRSGPKIIPIKPNRDKPMITPKSVCTSVNEVVCHGIPSEEEILEEGDIINVDVSTILDGYYSDASRMFIIGKTTPEKEKLVRVTKECLEIGMQAAKPFGFVGDIGNAIQRHAEKNGYSVVRDLCGHGVGLEFHEEPEVCHFGRKGTGMLLVPGMVFTIEPMINMGTWQVFIDEEDGWTVVTEDELPSAQWEHTFLMTETGLEILSY